MQTADDPHDGGCNHEQVTGDRDASEERPGLKNVSVDGACEHRRPKSEDECVEHPKEDESPFDLSKDGPPALSNAVSKIYGEGGKTYRYHPWSDDLERPRESNKCDRPRNRGAYRSKDNECSLIYPDVFSEGTHCTVRDAINPHPNRHDGEKCCQL